MSNSDHFETFSLNACHLHPRRTHWHPWNCQTSDIGPFHQKSLDRRSRHMPFDPMLLGGLTVIVTVSGAAMLLKPSR